MDNMTCKSRAFISLAAISLLAIIICLILNNRKVFIGDITKDQSGYCLKFEKMNREDSYIILVCKDDVFSANFRTDKGHADLIIGMDDRNPIYKGNDIETGTFDVIVPEDGEYRITVKAKHASGYVEVYAKKGGTTNNDD